MPANRDQNKIRVFSVYGVSSPLAMMDPLVNMKVRRGIDDRWVVGLDSGNFQVSLALASGGAVVAKAYPHELMLNSGQAAYFGWPNGGSGIVTRGHKGVFPNGIPVGVGSGTTYQGGDGNPHTFGR
jgi:hypothetical protein